VDRSQARRPLGRAGALDLRGVIAVRARHHQSAASPTLKPLDRG
jgi:hypothetical protein